MPYRRVGTGLHLSFSPGLVGAMLTAEPCSNTAQKSSAEPLWCWGCSGAMQDAAPGHSSPQHRAKSCSYSELPWVWTAGLGESKNRCDLPQKRGPAAPASHTKPPPLCTEQGGSCCSVLWELETCGHANKTASKDLKNRHAFTDASARCFWALGFEFLRAPRKGRGGGAARTPQRQPGAFPKTEAAPVGTDPAPHNSPTPSPRAQHLSPQPSSPTRGTFFFAIRINK